MYPAKFLGLGEALIFFCFFSCIKARKEDYEGKKKTPILGIDHSSPTENAQGAYAIRPYSLIPDRFRIRFATSLSKTRRVSLRHVAKSKTRRVSRYVVWQSPKPAGFYAMSCGKVQNPPGFTLCRVAKPQTRRVLRYIVWRNAKPVRYRAVGAYAIRPLGVFGRKRLSESFPHKFGHSIIRPLSGPFGGRMRYAPTA